MAQRVSLDDEVPLQRLLPTSMEDSCPEERFRAVGKKTLRCVPLIPSAFLADTQFLSSEYAAAFFLLGGSLKDAVNVCVRNLDDFQLGVAIARVMEQGDEGPVLRDVLTTSVLPIAFKKGNRWLANWAFWLLHRRDLAVRVLLVSTE